MSTTGVLKTKVGDLEFELFDSTPNTTKNFVTLAQSGFYKNLNFHRVIPNFVVQGGCPQGTGTGGPGYSIKCETIGSDQVHEAGSFSMAHAGTDTGGSQFFVVLSRQQTSHLDGKHTVYGKITTGLDLIDKIQPNDDIFDIEITNVSDVINNKTLEKGPAR